MKKRRANKSNASKDLEKSFLKQLKTIAKNEQRKTGKKVPETKPRKTKSNASTGRKDGGKKTGGRITKRDEPIQKVVQTVSVQPERKQGKKGTKDTKGKSRKTRVTGSIQIAPRKRGKEEINISFKGVKSIHKKVDLINESESIKKSISKQLGRNGGKPPKGIIIIVRDKKGNEAAHVSIPSFVVNEINVKKELKKFANELKEDYSQRQQDLADGNDDTESNGYQDYNPNNIQSITIKFIY